jgi:hypothetical protein
MLETAKGFEETTMNSRGNRSIIFVIILLVISTVTFLLGCTNPETSSPTLTTTKEPTATFTSTTTPEPTATQTEIPTPTATSIPEYTELGEQINQIVQVLGWEIVLCSDLGLNIKQETIENGIFLYRRDTQEYFCDLKGYAPEPVPELEHGERQYLLGLLENKGYEEDGTPDGYSFGAYVLFNDYSPVPTELTADDIVALTRTGASNLEEIRNWNSYSTPMVVWPLTKEQYDSLADLFLNEEILIIFQR